MFTCKIDNSSQIEFENLNYLRDDNGTDLIDKAGIQATFCILYTLIFVLGVFGNALVCYVVARNKTMQTVTNLFILNLALSDILLCLLAVPFTPLYTFLKRWSFGGALCHLVPFAQGSSIYISTLTLTSIAVDRFFVIIYPFKPRMKISVCIGLIVAIWVISCIVTSPYAYYMELQSNNGTVFCEEQWPEDNIRKSYGAISTCMQFVIPFIIIAVCYTCVSKKLNDRMRFRAGNKNTKKEEIERERKRKTNRMLISMVAIFGLSWLPLNLVNISADFCAAAGQWKYYMFIFFASHCIAMSSTIYNPFLYAWLNENFRKEFKLILPCFNFGRSFRNRQNGVLLNDQNVNGNDTVQESLMTSNVHQGYRIKIDDKNGERAVLKEEDENIDGKDVNLYLYSNNGCSDNHNNCASVTIL